MGAGQATGAPEPVLRRACQRRDVDGLVALYEREAALVIPTGQVARGSEAIRAAYQRLLAANPTFTAGEQAPAVMNGDLAPTSTRIPGGATVEVARRQHDGTWLWMIDQPNVLA